MGDEGFIPLEPLASKLGLPRNWLRAEADAGRIPCLKIGRRRLFNLETVRLILGGRAAESICTKEDLNQRKAEAQQEARVPVVGASNPPGSGTKGVIRGN